MTKKKSNKNKKNRRGIVSEPRELSPQALVYNGPVRSRADLEEVDTSTVLINYDAALASNSSGIVSSFLVNNISASPSWLDLTNRFDEYRVLAMRVRFYPQNRYSKTTTITTPLAVAIQRDGNTTVPSSYSAVLGRSSGSLKSLEDPWSITVKMAGSEEAQFFKTATVSPTFGVIIYADGLSATVTYGRYFVDWRVQLRGRR